jgi:hypothetical protein
LQDRTNRKTSVSNGSTNTMPTLSSDKETKLPAPSSRAAWLKQVRQLHLYLGTFFAPSIVFFALTGALQLFSLHEGHPGETYQPPAWVAKLGSIHKNQTLAERRGPPPGRANEQRKPPELNGERRAPRSEARRLHESGFTLALKWFFLATSIGLVFTTVLGIYMAFKYNRSRILVWSMLFAGTAIPAALIAMTA